ncbi:5'-methylthioadenosine/adenosylhomocysteine nucleosidase [Ramlibacter ginsenosidimutans]|uniref:adenosylhomocysteine nucleosidase n=1 Tax=Ramlibacter ginsenosidimutans TaxID=502333 RepID=A0A934TR74_9BURK|nr:5'-methylthioadenosine/adenosylhomocysteine nucleosidase [Ramlibacter ginsenosidimutans]MBK6005446.1 5'-methylthioadenosine/adenosylhomocysteine nucleosidase [Ramlibacter ginsenosidimutans]
MRTAIVSAMHEELAAVLALLPDEHKQVAGGREFWVGHLHGQEVVAVLSRIGKVAAATTATALIERFHVDRIVFTGVAGGLAPGVNRGDVVVADAFLQHDLDASPIFPRYEVPLYETDRFRTDAALTEQLVAAVRTALHGTHVHRGLVVSGDRFVSSAAESQVLTLALPEALAVEMEGAAFAQVCHDYRVPFAAVRTVSDRADDAAHGDFLTFIDEVASRHSAAIVAAFLRANC